MLPPVWFWLPCATKLVPDGRYSDKRESACDQAHHTRQDTQPRGRATDEQGNLEPPAAGEVALSPPLAGALASETRLIA